MSQSVLQFYNTYNKFAINNWRENYKKYVKKKEREQQLPGYWQ